MKKRKVLQLWKKYKKLIKEDFLSPMDRGLVETYLEGFVEELLKER